MTVAEWIGTAVMLAVPYLAIGAVWTAIHADELGAPGFERVVSILVTIVVWPALLVASVCVT